jgi:hypothetical protein
MLYVSGLVIRPTFKKNFVSFKVFFNYAKILFQKLKVGR